MSATPRLDIVAGILIPAGDLHTSAGRGYLCSAGHPRTDRAWRVCPICGSWFTEQAMLAPTPLYAHLLAWAGGDEDRLFCRDDEREGLHVMGYEEDQDTPRVFGVSPAPERSQALSPPLTSLPAAALARLLGDAGTLCRSVGLAGEPVLHVRGWVSY